MSQQLIKSTLDDLNKAAMALDIVKSWTQASGLVNYDLQRPAKLLYPVITPLRNMIPRVKGNGDTATRWKTITGINTTKMSPGVAEGKRSGIITTALVNQLSEYRGIGLEDNVTFEADYAAQGFDDALARAVQGLLFSTMIAEELVIVGGNNSLALGTTPTPSLTASASGGSLANGTLSVICVALTNDGLYTGSVSGGILSSVTRDNADGTQDTYGGYSAQKSANATVSVTGPTGSVAATVAVVRGAFGYAWFWGAAGSEVLGAITSINSVVITANATGTQTAASLPDADNSRNTLLFDGLLTQIATANSGSYFRQLATGTAGVGSTLTQDGAGGIVEIEEALLSFWENYRLGPDMMLVNAQELKTLKKALLGTGNSALLRYNIDTDIGNQKELTFAAGTVVGSYLNSYTMSGGQLMQIMLHPNVPKGTIIFMSKRLPEAYRVANVRNLLEMHLRRDYYQLQWPMRTRKYEYGVYCDETLVNYFKPAFGLITNIAAG